MTTLAVLTAAPAGASSCTSECVRRMAACRTERCDGLSLRVCRDRCRAVTGCRAGAARIRTLATVVSECAVRAGIWTGKQRLDIKRGDCPAETVVELPFGGIPDPSPSLCESYGRYRDGSTAVTVGAFQRVGVSPDGRTVLFEINTHATSPLYPALPFSVPDEGIFAMGPDRRVHRIADASRERCYRVLQSSNFDVPFIPVFCSFSFSPSGRFVTYSDRGPGSDGADGAQVVVVDLASGERTQVTRFRGATPERVDGSNVSAFFVEEDTLGGYSYAEQTYFTMRRDGTHFRPVVVALPGGINGTIRPSLQVAGPFAATATIELEGTSATAPFPGKVVELFGFDLPDRLLQLTTIGRSDTMAGPSLTGRDVVFFLSSGEPVPGQNPRHTCQLFSVDTFASRVRQLTHLDSPVPGTSGCLGGAPPPECRVALTSPPQFDPRTGTLVFDATCDPFGLHPVGGQVFAMRADGSGLRQLTNYHGMQGTAAEGILTVELPGPIESPGVKN